MREADFVTRKGFAGISGKKQPERKKLQEVVEIDSTAAVKEGIGISVLSRWAVSDDVDGSRPATVAINGHKLLQPFFYPA